MSTGLVAGLPDRHAAALRPVFISIPADDWERRCEWVPVPGQPRDSAGPALLAQLVRALDRSQRPAFVVGAGVDRDAAVDDVVALAEGIKRPSHRPDERAAVSRAAPAVRRLSARDARAHR
jgi:thiamine pyrophosphate-dependent acetolactate synthase large subunit-like protein